MLKSNRRLREALEVNDLVYYIGDEALDGVAEGSIGIVREVDDTILEGYLVEFRGKHPKDEDGRAALWTEKYWIDMAELEHVHVAELKTTE